MSPNQNVGHFRPFIEVSCLESLGSVQAARLIKETDSRTSSLNRNSKSEAALEHFEWPELYRNCIFPLCSTKTMIMQFKLDQDVILGFISLSIKYFDTLDKDTMPIYRLKMIFRRFCIEKNAKFQWYWKFLKWMLKIRLILLKISGSEFFQCQPKVDQKLVDIFKMLIQYSMGYT